MKKQILTILSCILSATVLFADSVVIAPVVRAPADFTVDGTLFVNGVLPTMPRSVVAQNYFSLEELMNNNTGLSNGWSAYSTGNGTTSLATTTSNAEYGLMALATTNLAGSTDRSGLRQGTTMVGIMLGGNRSHSFVFRAAPGTNADGTNTGYLLGGLGTTVTPSSGNDTSCVEWKSLNGGNFTCVTTNASNTTSTDSLIPPTSGTYRTLSFFINAAGSQVTFYSGTTLVATHTTNIPATTTALGYRVLNTRLASTANNQTATVDFVGTGYTLITPRWPQTLAP